MLSRPRTSTASRSCSRELLRTIVHKSPQVGPPRSCRGVASLIGQRSQRNCISRQNSSALPAQFAHSKYISEKDTGLWQTGKRSTSTAASEDGAIGPNRKDEIYALIDNINQNEIELAELLEDLDLLEEYSGILNSDGTDLDHFFSQTIGHRSEEALESRVRMARQQFKETLPEGYLNATEMQLYVRLYGEPIIREEGLESEEADTETDPDQLFREDGNGGWEEIEFEQTESQDDIPVAYDMEAGPIEEESITMKRTREVAEQLGGEVMLEQFEDAPFPHSAPRLHPLTVEGKFSTDPSTIFLPKDTVVGPISVILSEYSNKQIREVAQNIFGGHRLPHSTTTLPPRAQMPQLPIPLVASQHHMGEMEANAYLAVLYPGIYASVLSILVEVRKRLGTQWIRRLMKQEGGPNVLDAGGGGAGILAWRDVLRAEWELMNPDHKETDPIPMGKSTVLTGSDTLRVRAAAILEDTTFLPRLPDYVHVRDRPTLDDSRAPPKRKQYDIIIAPHTLLGIQDEYMRKEHVENLWSLLNPNGGVLIILEKGRQRGFEAVAGAREMLLKRYISSPGSTRYEDLTDSPNDSRFVDKEAGMIIAPCTNHGKCPMYGPGSAKGREDYCHFQQRYIRPQFLQRIIGVSDRNHEDVKFSYLAVQRGVDLRTTAGIVQDAKATEKAFAGYQHIFPDPKPEPEESEIVDTPATTATTAAPETTPWTPTPELSASENPEIDFHALSLPRLVYPPMKRRGHVILDVCTPGAKIERWIVPRSHGKRPFKDAGKVQWGDLWALGAKTRISRNLALGEGKKGEHAVRLAARAIMREREKAEDEEDEEDERLGHHGEGEEGRKPPRSRSKSKPKPKKKFPEVPILTWRKNGPLPNWVKKMTKKRIRQELKKRSQL